MRRHLLSRGLPRTGFNARRLFTEEQESLLKQVDNFVKAGKSGGAFKLGKMFCDAFEIKHPSVKTAKAYLDLLSKEIQQSSFKTILKVPTKQKDTMSLWTSKHSCFTKTPAIEKKNNELHERMKKYLVLDFETTTVQQHKRKASPFSKDNRVVYTAWGTPNIPSQVDGPFDNRKDYSLVFPDLSNVEVIVGHNIKFDLLYIWDNLELKDFFRRGGLIWDTMYTEYILNGHKDSGSLALDSLSLLYGGELKDNYIKEQWEKGINTPDIDETRMRDYAAADIVNTRKVFESQLSILSDGCRLPLIKTHMEGLLATTEMEYNGLFVDENTTREMHDTMQEEIEIAERELEGIFIPAEVASINTSNKLRDPILFNWTSSSQLRAYLFGGTVNYRGHTMNDKGKWSPAAFPVTFEGCVPEDWKKRFASKYTNRDGAWKVSDDVIASIAEDCKEQQWAAAITKLRLIKKTKKLSNTYLSAFVNLLDDESVIHPQLNHTFTRTGRLSSSNPNMQNIPRGDKSGIKKCLTTRFRDKNGNPTGRMIESDYSQLEVFVMALLSQDKTLMSELAEGADLHCKRLARMKGMDYETVVKYCKVDKDPVWTAQRTKAKVFSFQRQYGAGNKMISLTTGLAIEEVQQMVENEKKAYPAVDAYFARVTKALQDTAAKTASNEGFYDSMSGNRWYFEQAESHYSRSPSAVGAKAKEFKKQLVLNHPVQGFAAEIVLTILGKLWRHFMKMGNYSESGDFTTPGRSLLVNTVHDCVWIDTHAGMEERITEDVERILSDVEGAYKENGIDFPVWVGFKTETSSGITMADL
eukprot:TRINITY_DN3155_c0_g1_i1.p1 TRINITY_DN3155_c0_g1~~TRINITY_DN3155_c0_g1_i1.p1  ORF type:complete len:810 (+),score=162.54 TRINITY_DN3155_c0_g1_i1:70-2499(+)